MPEGLVGVAIVAGFLVFFPLLFMSVLYFTAWVGGWTRLGKVFATGSSPGGDLLAWCSGRLGWFANYNNCLNIEISARGVHLQPVFLLKTGHKPLLIPWDAVTTVSRRDLWLWIEIRLTVEVGDGGWPVQITLYGQKVADRIALYRPLRH